MLFCGFLCVAACDSTTNPATSPVPTFADANYAEVVIQTVAYAESADENQGMTNELESRKLAIDEIRIVVDEINIREDENDLEGVDISGPLIARLVSEGKIVNEELTELTSFYLHPRVYDTLLFNLMGYSSLPLRRDVFEDDVLADEYLPDHSVIIEGSFKEHPNNDLNDNGVRDRALFRFETQTELPIVIESDEGISVSSGEINYIFMVFDLDIWVGGLINTLQFMCDPVFDEEEEDRIVINDETNPKLSKHMRGRMHKSFRTGHGKDKKLDSSEVDSNSKSKKDGENDDDSTVEACSGNGSDFAKGSNDADKGNKGGDSDAGKAKGKPAADSGTDDTIDDTDDTATDTTDDTADTTPASNGKGEGKGKGKKK